MKRRDLISRIVGSGAADNPVDTTLAGVPGEKVSPFANTSLPVVARSTAGLEPYNGAWTGMQLMHLLRRTTFGPSRAHIASFVGKSLDTVVDTLLADPGEEPTAPLVTDARDIAAVGSTWVNSLYKSTDPLVTFDPSGLRQVSLRSWWMGLMMTQATSVREQMVLFWHNHFSTEMNITGDPRFAYRYVALLRRNALGNFKEFVRSITIDGSMLIYLNGNSNQKSGPDENYARELQELFTIGKGPLVGDGDYTNYTEADVKAAARVLTGWRRFQNADGTVGATTSYFTTSRHDVTNKTFSARYGNTVITGDATATGGEVELGKLLDMIFAQEETARYICRKLYRWFVYYLIDDVTEAQVIGPMALLLRLNNYDITPVLSALFKSAHFYDPVNMGCMIKNPLSFMTGLCRQFDVASPSTDLAKQYQGWYNLVAAASSMEQLLGDPPGVAGWPAYYQTPEYYEIWINSDILPKRARYSDALVGNGYNSGGVNLQIDILAFAASLSNPGDPNVLISELAYLLFPVPLTATQIAVLKETLLPGLPDYEWTLEWSAYIATPTNTTVSKPVKTKLQALIGLMLRMPEYQLA
jgi:uncharacterized protein (DUF1800 family)